MQPNQQQRQATQLTEGLVAEALLDEEVVRVRGSVLTNEGGGALEAADSAGGENSERCFDCKFSRGFPQPTVQSR